MTSNYELAKLETRAHKPQTIALDYDKTASTDPHVWREIIKLLRTNGHHIILLTSRYDRNMAEVQNEFLGVCPILNTNQEPKGSWAEENNLSIDIWIDDDPRRLFR